MVRLFCIQKGYREERGKLKVQLNWKESSYSKLPELHIAASEIVSDETFEQMQAHPLWDHDVIQKHMKRN